MVDKDSAFSVVYSRDADFDFRRNVLEGLHRALSAQHTANAIGDLQSDANAAGDHGNDLGSPLTPLTGEASPLTPLTGEASPLTPLTDVEDPGLRFPNIDTSSTPQLPASISQAFATTHLPITDPSHHSKPNVRPSAPTQPPPPLTTPTSNSSSRASKRKAQKKEAARRRAKKSKIFSNEYHPDAGLAEKHRTESSEISTQFDAKNLNISSKGYIGVRAPKKSSKVGSQDADELLGPKYKFELIEWDGKVDRPFSDAGELVVGVCVSAPSGDETWEDVHRRAAKAIEEARPHLVFDKKEKKHRRGKFPAVNVGISHGGGQPRPKVLDHSVHNKEVLDRLLQEEAFDRISGFTTGAFATWAPRLYKYENGYLNKLIAHDQELRRTDTHPRPQDEPLRRNFRNTPWACAAVNFGPQTICRKHLDSGNLAFGWCVITALGDYDYTKGGHLVIWDLKLVVQFPPGTSIMIPSCSIAHSNTRIRPGEKRFSFTQYSAGGIFRWVDNGYKTVEMYFGGLNDEEKMAVLGQLADQLEFGLSLYSTLDELRSRHSSD